jgi:amidase
MAHASDGLGSIRIPAAACGLVGLKPTRDRNPNGPEDHDRTIGLAVDHVVSRTVRDSAAMLDATGYPEAGAPYAPAPKARPYLDEVGASPGKLRIAWSAATARGGPIDPEVQAAVEAIVELLSGLGHEVVPFEPQVDWRKLYRAQAYMSASNFSAGMKRRIEALGREPADDELGQLARRAYEGGKRVTGQQALWGFQEVRVTTRRMLEQLEPFDAFLQPVMTAPAPRIEDLDPVAMPIEDFDKAQSQLYGYTPPANFTGAPSMSLPLAWSSAGLPIGLQFTGRYGDEATLFRLAGQLEKEKPWAGRRPPVWG